MRNPDGEAVHLLFSYYNFDAGRSFGVYVNDILIKEYRLDGKSDMAVLTEIPPLPESEIGKSALEVKFMTNNASRTAKTIEVRLLSDENGE